MPTQTIKLPQFALIKQYIEDHISSGAWPAGTRTPSENDLCALFCVSRMTARRALQELSDQKRLYRVPGSGTFVADIRPDKPSLNIYNPVDTARETGSYSNRILFLGAIAASPEIAQLLHVQPGDDIFSAVIVHLDRAQPIQWQALYANPQLAPAFLKQNYTKVTPDAYLDWIAPANSSDHQLQAVLPTLVQRRELGLTAEDSAVCMQLNRRCWRQQAVRSYSQLVHPANQFYLGPDLGYQRDSQ